MGGDKEIQELEIYHPSCEYTEEDLQDYLKSQGISVDKTTFTNLICDLLEMRIAQIKEYYKLDMTNPVVELILKKDFEDAKKLADLMTEKDNGDLEEK